MKRSTPSALSVSHAHSRHSTGRLLFRCDHFRDPAYAGVAGIYIVVLVKNKITGFNELAGADAHAVADGADDFAVARELEELPILSASPMEEEVCRPWFEEL